MTDDLMEDLFDSSGPIAGDDELASVSRLAEELEKAQAEVEMLEQALKTAKGKRAEIEFGKLPEAMAAIGMEEMKLTSGATISVRQVIRGSLPKDDAGRDMALVWLDHNGHGGLIKDTVVAKFEKGQGNLAGNFVNAMADAGITVSRESTVHPQTLAAFAREQLAAGAEVPLDVLGLWSGMQARVKK
jgi:hypothetical protein